MRLLVAIVVFVISSLALFGDPIDRETLLQQLIESVETKGNVAARGSINYYWELVDLYVTQNRQDEAYKVALKALELDPWQYKYQLFAAQYETESGNLIGAYRRTTFLRNNLQESAKFFSESKKLADDLEKRIDTSSDSIPTPAISGYYIYLATFPNISPSLVEAVAATLSSEFGIEVKIVNVGQDESQNNSRDKRSEKIAGIVAKILTDNSDQVIDDFLKGIKLTRADLKDQEGKYRFLSSLLSQQKDGNQLLAQIDAERSQLDASTLISQLRTELNGRIKETHSLGVVGITQEDIYSDDYNFIFGSGSPHAGIVSLSRFLDGNPESEHLTKRLGIQLLSTTGFVVGIPRCTNPNCARAYPHSLEELDRKNATLGVECREALVKVYSKLEKASF